MAESKESKEFCCAYCNTDSMRRALVLIEDKKKTKAVCVNCFKNFVNGNFV